MNLATTHSPAKLYPLTIEPQRRWCPYTNLAGLPAADGDTRPTETPNLAVCHNTQPQRTVILYGWGNLKPGWTDIVPVFFFFLF